MLPCQLDPMSPPCNVFQRWQNRGRVSLSSFPKVLNGSACHIALKQQSYCRNAIRYSFWPVAPANEIAHLPGKRPKSVPCNAFVMTYKSASSAEPAEAVMSLSSATGRGRAGADCLSPPDIETEAMPMVERMVPRALEGQLHFSGIFRSLRRPGLCVSVCLPPSRRPEIHVHTRCGVLTCAPDEWSESLLP